MRECSKAAEILRELAGLILKLANWVRMPRERVKPAATWMLPENNSS